MHGEEEALRDGEVLGDGASRGPDCLWAAGEVGGDALNGGFGGSWVDKGGEDVKGGLGEDVVEGVAGEAGGFVVCWGNVGEDLGDELKGEGVHVDVVECVRLYVCV